MSGWPCFYLLLLFTFGPNFPLLPLSSPSHTHLLSWLDNCVSDIPITHSAAIWNWMPKRSWKSSWSIGQKCAAGTWQEMLQIKRKVFWAEQSLQLFNFQSYNGMSPIRRCIYRMFQKYWRWFARPYIGNSCDYRNDKSDKRFVSSLSFPYNFILFIYIFMHFGHNSAKHLNY